MYSLTNSMNSKTSYTLSTSLSHEEGEKLPSIIFDSSIAKRLYLAQQKLRPVIQEVMGMTKGSSTVKLLGKPHYLSVDQYKDAVWAAQILNEVDEIICRKQSGKRLKKSYNLDSLNLERRDVKVNRFGKIYVDTPILVQLIELHNKLGAVINNIRDPHMEGSFSNDVCSYTQTEQSNLCQQNYSRRGKDNGPSDVEGMKPKIKINVLSLKNNYSHQRRGVKLKSRLTSEAFLPQNSISQRVLVMSAHNIKLNKSAEDQLSSANSKKKLSTLPEEKTLNSEVGLSDSGSLLRKTRSAGSITDQNSKITNVAGARKIILNCLHDLKRVRSFLEKVDIGVSTEVQVQRAVIDENNNAQDEEKANQSAVESNQSEVTDNESTTTDAKNQKKFRFSDASSSDVQKQNENDGKIIGNSVDMKMILPNPSETDSKGKCCCGSTYASETPMELFLDAGDENASKLIICIKGNTEEDGDVQIIIRQCSECKIAGGKELKSNVIAECRDDNALEGKTDVTKGLLKKDKMISGTEKSMEALDVTEKNILPGLNVVFDPENPSKSVVEPSKNMKSDEVILESEKPSDDKQKNILSLADQQEKPGINVIFDPNDPSKSIVEPSKNLNYDKELLDETEKSAEEFERFIIDSKQNINKTLKIGQTESCSRIKLYETTNLCFSTDNGQELIISLTIRPKTNVPLPKISLKDIFSESTTGTEKTSQEHTANILDSVRDVTVGIQDKLDHFIPLSRTKVCSSLEFDVSTMETRIKSNTGIKHINPGIVVRLREMGVSNLLRACRPVKCGRPAVLNEKLRKRLPYSASLTSLPLEERDADIIEQSLNMSVTRSKQFSINKKKTMAYFSRHGDGNNKINFSKLLKENRTVLNRKQ